MARGGGGWKIEVPPHGKRPNLYNCLCASRGDATRGQLSTTVRSKSGELTDLARHHWPILSPAVQVPAQPLSHPWSIRHPIADCLQDPIRKVRGSRH